MPRVTIRIFERNGSDGPANPVLLLTRQLETSSAKRLTSKRVAQLLLREFPEFECAGRVLVSETEEGWKASRAVRPTAGCSYHYIWQDAVVTAE